MKLKSPSNSPANPFPLNKVSDQPLDAFLTLRAFACLMVVILHCNPPRNAILLKGYDLSWSLFSHGAVGVWIFFVLSGYLMGKAFYSGRYAANQTGVIAFWKNRALRLFPLYYFAILILSIFVYPDILKLSNWGYLVRLCTFTYQPTISSPAIEFNSPLWSLSTELQFYFFVPFIYSLARRFLTKRQHIYIAAGLILLFSFTVRCLIWTAFHKQIIEQGNYVFKYLHAPLITNLDLFLGGFLVNPWCQFKEPNKAKDASQSVVAGTFRPGIMHARIIAVALIVILYLFTAHHLYFQELWNLPERGIGGARTSASIFLLQPLTVIVISFFIAVFEINSYDRFQQQEKPSWKAILHNPLKVFEILGILSYGIYIWHYPIIYKITSVFTAEIPLEAFYNRLVVTLILSTAMAVMSYYLVQGQRISNAIDRRVVTVEQVLGKQRLEE